MKLQIYDIEGFTTCSENIGADQLCCYYRFSHDAAEFLFSQSTITNWQYNRVYDSFLITTAGCCAVWRSALIYSADYILLLVL